ncbi:protein kinase domain-containing protein [Nonomuraea sp. bgisy101]|uniref:serine/threonine-protein kinase n=1 Tax=Nonomuraea sp. bgisy101 TaxID=3413784 RepID=UPI003D72F244
MSESSAIIGGRYRLIKTIGRGGMGTVWHAHDEVLGRDVAIKEVVPPPDLTGPEREVFTVRTLREARAAGRVAHPGVATVYDVVEESGHPWIVMELVRSRTLGAMVREVGPLEPARAAAIGLELLAALRAAHAAGVLHRDVKPDNVLLAEDGRAVLTDFGIATTDGDAPVTRTGVLLGTPAYIAPERAAGGVAEPASDLWSLGVTLYTAVEGHSPFQRGHPLATMAAVMHEEPLPMSAAGPLAPVICGLLRKDPGRRMSLDEAERRMRMIVLGIAPESTAPVPIGGAPPLPAVRRAAGRAGGRERRARLVALAVAALAVALVTGGMAWMSSRDPGPESRQPASVPLVVSTPSATSAPPPSPELTREGTGQGRSTGTYDGRPDGSPATGDSAPNEKRSQRPSPDSPSPTKPKEKTSPPATDTGKPSDEPGQVDPDDGQGQGQGQGQRRTREDQDQQDLGRQDPGQEAQGEAEIEGWS